MKSDRPYVLRERTVGAKACVSTQKIQYFTHVIVFLDRHFTNVNLAQNVRHARVTYHPHDDVKDHVVSRRINATTQASFTTDGKWLAD